MYIFISFTVVSISSSSSLFMDSVQYMEVYSTVYTRLLAYIIYDGQLDDGS